MTVTADPCINTIDNHPTVDAIEIATVLTIAITLTEDTTLVTDTGTTHAIDLTADTAHTDTITADLDDAPPTEDK